LGERRVWPDFPQALFLRHGSGNERARQNHRVNHYAESDVENTVSTQPTISPRNETFMRPSVRKSVFAGIAGLSLAGTVAGCAPSGTQSTAADAGASSPGASGAASPSGASSSLASSGSVYQDGTYSADGTYVSPNGTETVGVELTLASGKVTAVDITQHPSNPNTRKFQGEFAGGIAAQIVGKNIDELNVSKVAGSSLTSGGFNQAVEKIKAEAQ
jgi:uncharacterized protein with FMN-binding domain